MKKIFHSRLTTILIASIILLITARVALLPITPPGFYLDEAAGGAHVVALLHHGTNAQGTSWPLFSTSLGGGYTTPIYLYPLAAWASIFGTHELSLRYFSVFAGILALFIFAYALRLWLGKKSMLFTLAAGLALPWGWLQGSLAWDPALVPLFVALAFWAFSTLYHKPMTPPRSLMYALLPASLIALAYLYPPCRVTAPLLFVGAYALLYIQKIIGLRGIVVTCLVSTVLAIPLLEFMLTPEALTRSQELSVFHGTSLLGGIWHLIVNFAQLLNPIFLFAQGDPNLRHSTGYAGMLGIATLVPLIVTGMIMARRKLLPRESKILLGIGVFGIFAGFLGSALTTEGQPHSLRATAAWLFILLLIVIGWQIITDKVIWRPLRIIVLGVFVIGTLSYGIDLAVYYPARASESFDVSTRTKLLSGQHVPDYPALARQYYETR